MRANGEVVDRVTDNYNTAILSRIYNLENYVKNKFQTIYNKYFKTQIKFEFICCLNINLSIFFIKDSEFIVMNLHACYYNLVNRRTGNIQRFN